MDEPYLVIPVYTRDVVWAILDTLHAGAENSLVAARGIMARPDGLMTPVDRNNAWACIGYMGLLLKTLRDIEGVISERGDDEAMTYSVRSRIDQVIGLRNQAKALYEARYAREAS